MPSRRGSAVRSRPRSTASAPSCCWRGRPASARPASSRPSSSPPTPVSSGEPRGRRRPAYGPIVAALRQFSRADPAGLGSCGPLRPHLALLLPELGDAVEESDRPTLFEAIRCGLEAVAAERPAVILLDDLQWSDDATLELLSTLAGSLPELPILVVGAYRSDEIPRAHGVRRLRNELRRTGAPERALARAAERGRHRRAARSDARRRSLAGPRPRALRAHQRAPLLHRGACRRACRRRPARGGRRRPRARSRRRGPVAADDPRCRPAARRRALAAGRGRRPRQPRWPARASTSS